MKGAFLRKSQNFIDEKIFKGEEQKSGQKKANVDLTSGIKTMGKERSWK